MNKKNLKNSDLNLIGKRLIERGSLPLAEIDNIVSNPELFTLVNARIASYDKGHMATGSRSSLFSFVRRNAVAFAGIAVVVTVALAMTQFRYERVPIAANAVQVPAQKPVAARPDLPPQEVVVVGSNPSPGRALYRDVIYEKAVVRQVPVSVARRPQRIVNNELEEDFYAITYGGDPGDTSDGGRVIRVDMKRSSLLAMGLNVPLENDDSVVRADLLVGRDGVTRAIRIIK